MPHKVIISGGGTGGHIFPAVAIAKEIQRRYPDTEILFIGANWRMEMEKVPQEGYAIQGLDISGLKRSLSLENFKVLWRFVSSYFKAKGILKSFQPDVVIGTGGYASLAILAAAGRNGYPGLIWEGNGYAGLTNKLLAKRATVICTGFEGMEQFFPAEKTVCTGNPVRPEILKLPTKAEGLAHFGFDSSSPVVFITGGSLGARTINQSIQQQLQLLEEAGIQLIWQTGKNFQASTQKPEQTKIYTFLKEMHLAYAASDLVVSRAGALSIAEIAVAGKASILVPSPNVTDDHQTQNALKITQIDGARLVKDSEAASTLVSTILNLCADSATLKNMQEAVSRAARPEATAAIVNEVEKIWKH